MKKIYIVLQDKAVLSALERLRGFGAVHIEHIQKPESDKATELLERLKISGQAVSILSQIKAKDIPKDDSHTLTAADVVERTGKITRLKEDMAKRSVLIAQWEPWGNFDPQEIKDVESKGVFVQLFEYQEGEKLDIPKDAVLKEILVQGKKRRCVAVSLKSLKLSVESIALPQMGLKELINLQEKDRKQILELERSLEKDAAFIDGLKQSQKILEEELAFHQAFAGRGEEEELVYFKGFCPKDSCVALKEEAAKNQWAVLIEDPEEEDDVPTLLQNPKWVELINPVFDLINVLPGYKEVDISAIFLFFFSIFFGMLIGDAGYGLIFGLITLYAQIKMGKKVANKTPFILMYVLSFMAIGWGVLTGTYFGQKWVAPYIPALMPWLTEGANVQKVCFFLGALHLSLAHTWRAILRIPSLTALAEVGWSLWIWGMFFLVRQLIVDVPMPVFGPVLMIAGAVLAVLFSAPNKNIFKMLLGGFSAFIGSFINAFTDVISYIRLFAVGLATVAIADAFNDIALGVGFSNIFTGFATALILFIGHALNLVLAAMAILVHGLRLNVLEFSNHMGVQWAGIKFTPFKKNTH